MSKHIMVAVGAGILCAALFFFSGLAGGTLMFFTPLLPLFFIGMTQGMNAFSISLFTGLALISLLSGLAGGATFVILLAIPAAYLARQIALHRTTREGTQWYPVLHIICGLCLYASLVFLATAAQYTDIEGGLQTRIIAEMSGQFTHLDPMIAETAKRILTDYTYLLVACIVWIWLLIVYAMGFVAHIMAEQWGHVLRPHFSLIGSTVPTWMLALLLLGAVLSLLGVGQVQFIGRSLFAIFMLPYFLSGLTRVHQVSLPWHGRGWLLTGLYLVMLTMWWPVLIVAVMGLAWHVQSLLERGYKN